MSACTRRQGGDTNLDGVVKSGKPQRRRDAEEFGRTLHFQIGFQLGRTLTG
jgi:hypothetical protein